jgi:hypothetical protein
VQDSSGLLEEAEWEIRGGELQVRVAASQTIADLTLSPDSRRQAAQAASAAAGRPLKLRVIGGGRAGAKAAPASRNGHGLSGADAAGSGARARAARDPVVQRMQEKFAAEIRTVIDYKEKA